MHGLFRKRKQNYTDDLQNKVAGIIAKKILYLQANWAYYMDAIFKRLSVKGRVLILCLIGCSMAIWCILTISGSTRKSLSIEQGLRHHNPSKQLNMPTDSLMMMEHIYKTFKKYR